MHQNYFEENCRFHHNCDWNLCWEILTFCLWMLDWSKAASPFGFLHLQAFQSGLCLCLQSSTAQNQHVRERIYTSKWSNLGSTDPILYLHIPCSDCALMPCKILMSESSLKFKKPQDQLHSIQPSQPSHNQVLKQVLSPAKKKRKVGVEIKGTCIMYVTVSKPEKHIVDMRTKENEDWWKISIHHDN